MNWKDQLKNPYTYVGISLLLGIVLIFWGLGLNESDSLEKAKTAPWVIGGGVVLFLGSFLLLVTGNIGKR